MTKEVKCFEIEQRQLNYTSASLTGITEFWIVHCYLHEYNALSALIYMMTEARELILFARLTISQNQVHTFALTKTEPAGK